MTQLPDPVNVRVKGSYVTIVNEVSGASMIIKKENVALLIQKLKRIDKQMYLENSQQMRLDLEEQEQREVQQREAEQRNANRARLML